MSAPMLSIGIGCRKNSQASAIIALIGAARAASPQSDAPMRLCTIDEKKSEMGLAEAARCLNLDLVFLPRAALASAMPRASRSSARVEKLFGVGSIAEAAALADAGAGSQLVVKRMSRDGVTCAIAAPLGELP